MRSLASRYWSTSIVSPLSWTRAGDPRHSEAKFCGRCKNALNITDGSTSRPPRRRAGTGTNDWMRCVTFGLYLWRQALAVALLALGVGGAGGERKGDPYNSEASEKARSAALRAPRGSPASPPTPQHIHSRGMVQRAIIAPLLMHGGGGLAPRRGLRERGPQPERPS